MIESTRVDSFVKSATIQSSDVDVVRALADTTSAGISTLAGMGVASDSTSRTSGGKIVWGRTVFTVVMLTERGDRARGWVAGVSWPCGRLTV